MASSSLQSGVLESPKSSHIKARGACFSLKSNVFFMSGGFWANSQCKSGVWSWGKSLRSTTDAMLPVTLHRTSHYPDNNAHSSLAYDAGTFTKLLLFTATYTDRLNSLVSLEFNKSKSPISILNFV